MTKSPNAVGFRAHRAALLLLSYTIAPLVSSSSFTPLHTSYVLINPQFIALARRFLEPHIQAPT